MTTTLGFALLLAVALTSLGIARWISAPLSATQYAETDFGNF